jgi:hypothetical protein
MATEAPSASAAPPATSVMVSIPAAIAASFKLMKQRRVAQWKVYRIDEATFTLVEEHSGAPSPKAVADLLRVLPPADGRYFVFDIPTKNSYGGVGSRLLFFTWAPTAAGRANVIYAAQRRVLDATFSGTLDAHATSRDDVEAALKPDEKGAGAEDEWDPDA